MKPTPQALEYRRIEPEPAAEFDVWGWIVFAAFISALAAPLAWAVLLKFII
jgi:hypothetical protein